MTERPKNIFISHVHEDDETLQDLKKLLDSHGYKIRDSSIDSTKPNEAQNADYIKSGILAPRINWASTVLVLISPETHTSDWVDWEVEYGHSKDKRIVGVWAQGAKESDVPKALDQYADAVVGWQADTIMDAITGKINNWYTPSGEERPARTIDRYNC